MLLEVRSTLRCRSIYVYGAEGSDGSPGVPFVLQVGLCSLPYVAMQTCSLLGNLLRLRHHDDSVWFPRTRSSSPASRPSASRAAYLICAAETHGRVHGLARRKVIL